MTFMEQQKLVTIPYHNNDPSVELILHDVLYGPTKEKD